MCEQPIHARDAKAGTAPSPRTRAELSTHLGEVLGEGPERRGVEGARAESELLGLLGEGLDDVRVAVALVDGAVGAQAVEVLVAL